MVEVFGFDIDFSFQVLYLGRLPEKLKDMAEMYMFKVMLVASKKAITKKWLNQQAPKLSDWFDVMHTIYMMEKMTFALRLKTDAFDVRWQGWISFIKDFRLDFC